MSTPGQTAPPPAFDRIEAALAKAERILITTHVNPDGDGLGAELGLWAHLRARGKDARIVNPDALADRYRFLAEAGEYEAYDPEVHEPFIRACDAIVVLDISNWGRLDELGRRLESADAVTICIDHHPFEDNGMADLYAVDLGASATGQLVYEMLHRQGHEIDRTMALGFYVAILTDTGSFRFSNADPRAHRATAELLEHDLDPNELYESVYGNSTLERILLLGHALGDLRVIDDARILLLVMTRKMVEESGAKPSDTEGFVDIVRSVEGCEGVGLLLEREDGSVKVSLRSRGRINVNRVARAFGGGGHVYASGATADGPLERTVERVIEEMRASVADFDRGLRDGPV